MLEKLLWYFQVLDKPTSPVPYSTLLNPIIGSGLSDFLRSVVSQLVGALIISSVSIIQLGLPIVLRFGISVCWISWPPSVTPNHLPSPSNDRSATQTPRLPLQMPPSTHSYPYCHCINVINKTASPLTPQARPLFLSCTSLHINRKQRGTEGGTLQGSYCTCAMLKYYHDYNKTLPQILWTL